MVRIPLLRVAALTAFILLAGFANNSAIGETILLDFGSPSCGPCRQMRPVIHDMIADGYPIREIDLSREAEAAREFRVMSVPCFILLVDGQVADRVEGSVPRATIEAMFHKVGYEPRSKSTGSETLVRGQSPNRGSLLGGRLRDRVTGVNPAAPRTFGDSPFASSTTAPESRPAYGGQHDNGGVASGALPDAGVAANGQTQRLIESTVRIEVADATGKSYGTGTIIHSDSGEAIVLTCGHLFRETRGQSPVAVEFFRSTPAGAEQSGAAQGDVLSYDLDRDIGVIRVRTNGQVPSVQLAAANTAPQSGDSVVSVGCDHGQPPSPRNSHITTVNRYTGPSNIEATGAPVEGRSGGGLFDVQGRLIGVCFAADARGNEGLYSGLPSVYEELARAGVQLPNREPTLVSAAIPTSPVHTQAPSPAPQPGPGFNSLADVASPANPIAQVGEPMPAPASIRPEEQAALEEVARRADNSEVIFIIRSKTPGGRSQIIKLEDASPAFVSALVDAAATHSGTRLTSHEVSQPSMPPNAVPTRTRPAEPAGTQAPASNAENWSSTR